MALVTRMTPAAIDYSFNYTIQSTPELKEKKEVSDLEIIVLQFWNKGLTTVSIDILRFRNLQVLHLSGNALESIPDFIGDLTQLKKLSLARNKLREFPRLPPNLEKLYLTDNQLDSIPSLKDTKLKTICLDHNRIRTLPANPFPPTTTDISLSYNEISDLPLTEPLTELTCLFINDNRLKSLPLVLKESTRLWKIELQRNPTFPLPEWSRKVTVVYSSPTGKVIELKGQ